LKNRLKKIVCLGLLSFSVTAVGSLWEPVNVYAEATVTSETEAAYPSGFSERIKKLLDEYHTQLDQSRISMPAHKDSVQQPQQNSVDASKDKMDVPQVIPSPSVPPADVHINSTGDTEPTYDFDWQGTPLSQTLYAVAKIANRDVVVNGQLSGTVYTSMHNVTCAQALDYLSRSFNFNWMVDENNAIVISTADLMKQSQIFTVHYADKDKVKDELKSLGIDDKNIYSNMENGSISVTGTPYQLAEAAKRIRAIDHPISQCLVVAQLIDISRGHSLNLGMQYTLPTYTHSASTDSSTDSLRGNFLEKLTFSASTEASRELSKGRVIARPMVMMLNGQQGNVSFGDKVPVLTTTTTTSSTEVTVDYKDVGTTLKVTPVIDKDSGDISMKIDAEISNIASWVTSGQTKAPQISSRHATTSAHLKSGQSFVIGGLMSVNELDNLSGIPGLMDLPILGKLFSYHSVSKSYDEVYIMITPYIVTDDTNSKEILKKVGE
jgi:type II secretory pathway component GspD/PulD (secretin)